MREPVGWVSPAQSQAGGNLLLLASSGMEYVYEALRRYLGVSWSYQDYEPLGDCLSTYPGLIDMGMVGKGATITGTR